MKLLLLHRFRYLVQQIANPDVAIAGGYHYGNAGDMLLGRSVQHILRGLKRIGSLQTIYNLYKWPKAKKIILGGGAIAYQKPIEYLMQTYPNPKDILILGVDFNEENYSEDISKYLSQAFFIVVRSNGSANRRKEFQGFENIKYLPDLSFTWSNESFVRKRTLTKKKQLIVNLMPIYMMYDGRNYVPIKQYQEERKDIYPNINEIFKAYIVWANNIIISYRLKGYDIVAIPFTPTDEDFMKREISLNKNEILPYAHNLFKYLDFIIESDFFLCTRYHATILGLRGFCNIIPFAYARKNEELLQGFGFDNFIHPLNVIELKHSSTISFKVDPTHLIETEYLSRTSYQELIENFINSDGRI